VIARRTALRGALLVAVAALSAWLAWAGRGHTLYLDNHTVATADAAHRALEGVAVSVDGGPAEELERAERVVRQVAGSSHRVTIELRSGPGAGTRVVRDFRIPFGWESAVVSVPAAAAGAQPGLFVTRYQPPPEEEAPAEQMLQQQDSAIVPLAPEAPARR
jgi:hypothetical protein